MRVFLINPPSPEPVRSPLLAFCYLAAALRRGGHEVALLEASADGSPRGHAAISEHVAAFSPDLIGIHIKTQHVQPAYALARALKASLGVALVAGGPHATVCPDEPLRNGFDYVIRGEAEDALVELASAIGDRARVAAIPGVSFNDRGFVRHAHERPFLTDLDSLPDPLSALDLFDARWYGKGRVVAPAGLLSSRGCPAACTFCSNNVTGRRFRYHSAERVAREAQHMRGLGVPAMSFFDDSFAVGHRRVSELADALAGTRIQWTCTAHPAHLDRETVRAMMRAGCVGIDIGMESGDPSMLLRIGKGVTTSRVLDVLAWTKAEGVHTVLNLMFGWPDETDAELQATIDFMAAAAPLAGGFNARGVVVPYPGTELYERNHERFGFTEWWIREPPLDYVSFPTEWSIDEVTRAYASDAALSRNFFGHPPHRLAMIARALELKAEHTFRHVQTPRLGRVPAAGAR